MFLNVVMTCVFVLKVCGLVDVPWWLVAPLTFLAWLELDAERK